MSDQIAVLRSHPMTVADLESMPNDGRRYELIDGMLFVSPAPTHLHQRMAFRLGVALDAACPADLEVLMAPFDVQSAPDSVVQPDVLVARRKDITDKNLPVAPLLAVEVLSASSWLYDRHLKKALYARIGVASYWLLDPAAPGAIEIHELEAGGTYRLVGAASGDDVVTVGSPFPFSVCPARLLEDRRSGV